MVTFVAAAFSDRPARRDRASDAESSTEPAQYRGSGGAPAARPLVPRQRVAYIQPGGDETHVKAGVPGDDPDRYPVAHRRPGPRPNMYETAWPPRRHRKGRRRARRPGHTMSILIAMSAVSAAAGGIIAISGAKQPTTVPFTVDAAAQQRSDAVQAATRGGVRVSPAQVAPPRSAPASYPVAEGGPAAGFVAHFPATATGDGPQSGADEQCRGDRAGRSGAWCSPPSDGGGHDDRDAGVQSA